VFLHDITSLSLIVAEVEALVRELYGDGVGDALNILVHAISRIAEELVKHLHPALWLEQQDADDWDYIWGYGLPSGQGISGSDHRRAHAALDRLWKRVLEIERQNDTESKYANQFASQFRERIVMDDAQAQGPDET
jgi:hypothetical protein